MCISQMTRLVLVRYSKVCLLSLGMCGNNCIVAHSTIQALFRLCGESLENNFDHESHKSGTNNLHDSVIIGTPED